MDLFTNSGTNILPYEGLVNYHGPIIPKGEADEYLASFLKETSWKTDERDFYDKHVIAKRLWAWYSEGKSSYGEGEGWPKNLWVLKKLVEEITQIKFNSCLMNFYPDGSAGLGWHSDKEAIPQKLSAIASLSFGAERKFLFKHIRTEKKIAIELEHGGLLLMRHPTQRYWLHALPKTKTANQPRVNLTFRVVDLS